MQTHKSFQSNIKLSSNKSKLNKLRSADREVIFNNVKSLVVIEILFVNAVN